MMSKVSKNNKKKNSGNVRKAYSYIFLFVIGLFIFYLFRLNVLPSWINITITVILSLVTLILLFFINNRRVKDNIRFKSLIASIILLILFGIIDYHIFNTLNFIGHISNSENMINYPLITINDSNISKLKDIGGKKIGYYEGNSKVLKRIKSSELIEYEDLSKLYTDLFDQKIDAILIEQSMKDLADENNSNYSKRTKVIYVYKEKEKSATSAKIVDVTSKPFIIYLSGIDTEGEVSSVSRSDVNIVITINPITHKILLVSIPRDYYVKLHSKNGYKDKLTHAGIYGVDESIKTIEDILDIDINYYVRVNFTSVRDIVDTLGGITVTSDYDFTSTVDGRKFTKGINNLDGQGALDFARERYSFKDGDRQRGRNQEEVIRALLDKVTNPKILFKYNQLLSKLSSKVDTNISDNELFALAKLQLNQGIKWELESCNLDGSNSMEYTYSYPQQKLYVMIPGKDSIETAKDKISEYLGDNNE